MVVDLLKKLHIREVRFSMRWNMCVTVDNKVDISLYLPWLQKLIAAGIQITLSCGPIKSPRYPESYVPHHITYFLTKLAQPYYKSHPIGYAQLENQFGKKFMSALPIKIQESIKNDGYLPPVGQYIHDESPLALCALDYLDRLLQELSRSLGAGMNQIVMFNPENESRNPFGTGKYLMEASYMTKICEIILSHKPNARFLFNSAGVSDGGTSALEETAALATYLQELFPLASFTVGMDSYEEQNIFRFPYWNFFPDTIAALNILYPAQLITNTLTALDERGITFEATELQFERWGSLLRAHPPGTLYHLQFMLLRYMNTFLQNKPQLVRLWGFEQFMKKYLINPDDSEVSNLITFIHRINSQLKQPQ